MGATTHSLYYIKTGKSSRLPRKGGIFMNTPIKRVPISILLWIWIREWQKDAKVTDEELAGLLKVNVRTLKSYDISAHGLTLEKLDNLACTAGEYPIKYIMSKYLHYTVYTDNSQTQNAPATVYPNSTGFISTFDRIMAGL